MHAMPHAPPVSISVRREPNEPVSAAKGARTGAAAWLSRGAALDAFIHSQARPNSGKPPSLKLQVHQLHVVEVTSDTQAARLDPVRDEARAGV